MPYILREMQYRAGFLALSALALVLAAACAGSSGTTTNVRTVEPGSRVTPNAVTGTGELDTLIVAAVGGDDIALAGLAGYQKLPCKKAPAPGELAPTCRATEDEGTEVEALPVSGCDRALVRPEQVPDAFRTAFPGKDTNVLSVYRPKADPAVYGGGFGAGEVIVFTTGTHPNTSPMGAALHVKDGRIVWLESDCDNVSALVAPNRVDSFILDLSGTPGSGLPTQPPADAPAGTPADAPAGTPGDVAP
jgi:hypothetical protein